MENIYINRWSFWEPKENDTESPQLPFAPTMFKRRLNQLSRMVLHTIHEVAQGRNDIKITFSSIYGETVQQCSISMEIGEKNSVAPAKFGLSVFNVSVALSTILEKNSAGYTALCAGENSFEEGLRDCVSALNAGDRERIFVYGDELLPDAFQALGGIKHKPCSLALFLSKEQGSGSILLPQGPFGTARDFLNAVLV
ncbi:MAG: beta-ketoacyl synthase chain length factor [Candidatus Fibromonas sp.]|jgi:hypothetical protein|nr:beta-ketoacyl synthase chain length factor [Candidatus Fibromonas sp.]